MAPITTGPSDALLLDHSLQTHCTHFGAFLLTLRHVATVAVPGESSVDRRVAPPCREGRLLYPYDGCVESERDGILLHLR